MNALLFAATVLIWGTTWIAIALQVGPVPVLVSIFYRFATAAVLFLATLALSGRLKWPARRHQPWIAGQALCLFCLNFICFYTAASSVPSGLIAVIFSLATIFNAINARLFWHEAIRPRTLLAAALGVIGLALLFGPEIAQAHGEGMLKGAGFATLGTLFFSFGNMISRRNSAAGISPVTANAWGMAYGTAALLALIGLTGAPIVAPSGGRYIGAMLYLAVFGSIAGFTCYLTLVARIGSSRAAYATVLFPIVALAISTVYEGYRWHWLGVVGLLLTLLGNIVMFAPPLSLGRFRPSGADMSQAKN